MNITKHVSEVQEFFNHPGSFGAPPTLKLATHKIEFPLPNHSWKPTHNSVLLKENRSPGCYIANSSFNVNLQHQAHKCYVFQWICMFRTYWNTLKYVVTTMLL